VHVTTDRHVLSQCLPLDSVIWFVVTGRGCDTRAAVVSTQAKVQRRPVQSHCEWPSIDMHSRYFDKLHSLTRSVHAAAAGRWVESVCNFTVRAEKRSNGASQLCVAANVNSVCVQTRALTGTPHPTAAMPCNHRSVCRIVSRQKVHLKSASCGLTFRNQRP
jgi:hypothetical protein